MRIAIALASGILLGSVLPVSKAYLIFPSLIALVTFVLIINKIYTYQLQVIFGLAVNLIFLVLGISIYHTYNKKPVFHKNGYFEATLLELPQVKSNSFESVAVINSFIRNDTLFPTHEQVIIYFSKDNEISNLQVGNILLFRTNPELIKNFGNPYEFDYRKYLEQKKIYRQVYLDNRSWIKTKYTRNSLPILAEKTRQKLLKIYQKLPIDKKELEILSALTLGYKRDLDPETKHVFSSAGAMHVLAVSGLHVGIIFWIIIFLLGNIRKRRAGRIIFTVFSVTSLWIYAFITGLSPSVMRAAAMFSIFIFSEIFRRKSNIYNSLAASAFFILLFNPNNLFEAGFQLSYSAVFGIVYLQPIMSSFINLKNKVLIFFMNLLIVSIAAQIATTPFTIYYFGQFPSYFWLTNIIIIPAVMILIPLGIFLLCISGLPLLANVAAIIINTIIKFIYLVLTQIEHLPFSVLHLTISKAQQLIIISITLMIFILLKSKKTQHLHLAFLGTLILIVSFIYQNISILNKKEVIIYNDPKNATLELIHHNFNVVISENEIKSDTLIQKAIARTTQKLRLKPPQFFTVHDTVVNQNIFKINGTVYFEGKIIQFGENQQSPGEIFNPDIIINPQIKDEFKLNGKQEDIVITNKRYIPKGNINKNILHYTTFKTAYRKIW